MQDRLRHKLCIALYCSAGKNVQTTRSDYQKNGMNWIPLYAKRKVDLHTICPKAI